MKELAKNGFVAALVFTLVAMIAWYFGATRTASAAPKPGLWWTSKTEGLAQVQKLEDSSNGVVCYLARNPLRLDGPPSISCVKP